MMNVIMGTVGSVGAILLTFGNGFGLIGVLIAVIYSASIKQGLAYWGRDVIFRHKEGQLIKV